MAASTEPRTAMPARPRAGRRKHLLQRALLHVLLISLAAVWLVPILWTGYTSLRPFEETTAKGYFSWPSTLTLSNFTEAWTGGQIGGYYLNTFIITIPAVLLAIFGASLVAFVISRHNFRGAKWLLLLFTAGTLLPYHVLLVPLFQIYNSLPLPTWLSESGRLYDSYLGLIAIHVAFQLGFCVFVLTNYMRQIPRSLDEAATVDGASKWHIYRTIVFPLTRPAFAALATLEFTWIWNDFLWALTLMKTADKFPITSALNNLKGEYITNYNLLAAGALLAAIPTLAIYIALQRHFVAGLTVGATKG